MAEEDTPGGRTDAGSDAPRTGAADRIADHVAEIWRQHCGADPGAQADIADTWREQVGSVLADSGLQLLFFRPSGDSLRDGNRLRDLLTARGIPRAAIRLLEEAADKPARDKLLADCRNATVAVLIAPTPVGIPGEVRDAVAPHLIGVHSMQVSHGQQGSPVDGEAGRQSATAPGDLTWHQGSTPVGHDLRWTTVRQKPQLISGLVDFPQANPLDGASRPTQARGRGRPGPRPASGPSRSRPAGP